MRITSNSEMLKSTEIDPRFKFVLKEFGGDSETFEDAEFRYCLSIIHKARRKCSCDHAVYN
jgi:hypothetical protein